MRVGIVKEHAPGERRVATVPEVAASLIRNGHEISLETGAGAGAGIADERYRAVGVVVNAAESVLASSELICKVQPPLPAEIEAMAEGAAVVSFLQPLAELDIVRALVRRRITAYSLDLLPRITRAQSMDALSSQATVSGYRAVLVAAERLPKFFPMFITAAGTIPPAKVLVLGAGVAGLQAIATARRLGAVVRAYDVRPAAAEEVRSLGATFVELALEAQAGEGGYAREQSEEFLARQRELIGVEVARADVVITTAAIPGRRAPVLVTAEMVRSMGPGSVIVDLAAESGGNCELSRPGEEIDVDGVLVYGVANLPSSMPVHASFLFARNIAAFVELLASAGGLTPDLSDDVLAGCCVTFDGTVHHAPTAEALAGTGQ